MQEGEQEGRGGEPEGRKREEERKLGREKNGFADRTSLGASRRVGLQGTLLACSFWEQDG